MTPEELMKPRYKVIAIDTTETFQVGEILNHPEEWHDYLWVGPSGKIIFYPEKYPHLFKKLEWWEERKPEEMPEYVKGYDRVYKMINWTHNTCGEYFDEVEQAPNRVMFEMKKLEPATADEYEAYLQTLTVK